MRQAKLAHLLMDEHIYLPAKYYAGKLNVSERTIFNDLDKLNKELEKHDVYVEKKQNQGIKINGKIATSSMFYQFLKKFINEEVAISFSALDRQILIIKWLMLENKTLTYQTLSLDLFCSTSVLNKDFKQLQFFLDDHVSLISDVKGTRIKGTEIGIQRVLKRFIYFIFEKRKKQYIDHYSVKHLKMIFEEDIISAVEQTIEELVSILNQESSEQYLKSLFIFLLILTARSRRGNNIQTLSKTELKQSESLSNYPLAVQIGNNIASKLEFTFTELEIQHISDQLYAHRIEIKLNNKYIENLLKSDISNFISKVSLAMEIDLTKDEKLENALIYHMLPLIYRLKTNTVIHNPLLTEIKNNYSTLFKMVWYGLENLENKYGIKMSDNEVTFLTIYFQASIEREVQTKKVLVVCQTGIVTSDLIMNRIKNLLPVNIHFKLIAKPELTQENIEDVDFIISSVCIDEEPKPIVYVSPIINKNDLMNIYSFYLKYSTSNTEMKNKQKIKKNNYLDLEYVYLNENLTNKVDCLNKMITKLEQDNIVSSSFKQSVYEREDLGNTIIHEMIAVPHGNKTEVNSTKIAIMLNKSPVQWNQSSSVSLIVLLAVTEQDIKHVRKLLGEFFRNILSIESIEIYLKNITTLEQLTKLFSYDNEYM